jgi:glycosyltransferase involved in cell wall biosynthesis
VTARRPVVLVVVGRYLPGFRAGGPVRSVQNMVDALHAEFDFRVVALDRDLGDNAPYPGLVDGWMRVGNAEVRYLPAEAPVAAIVRVLREGGFDLLYLNTFFDPRFALLPLAMRRLGLMPEVPVLIAPRGQFSEGAMRIGRARKRVVAWIARTLLLTGAEEWQATAEAEVPEIRTLAGAKRVHRASNVPPIAPPLPQRAPKVAGALRAVFLSRVTRKKNLLGAVSALAGVRGQVVLDVVGPIEDHAYWDECRSAATAASVTVVPHPAVEPAQVFAEFGARDLFLFPTFGENFGHVILESLLAGTPCLLSDRTPWRDLEASHAGWDLPLEAPAAFTTALQQAVDADEATWAAWREGARAHAERHLACDQSVQDTRAMLRAAFAAA